MKSKYTKCLEIFLLASMKFDRLFKLILIEGNSNLKTDSLLRLTQFKPNIDFVEVMDWSFVAVAKSAAEWMSNSLHC